MLDGMLECFRSNLDQTRNIEIRFDIFITDCNSFCSPKLIHISLLTSQKCSILESQKSSNVWKGHDVLSAKKDFKLERDVKQSFYCWTASRIVAPVSNGSGSKF